MADYVELEARARADAADFNADGPVWPGDLLAELADAIGDLRDERNQFRRSSKIALEAGRGLLQERESCESRIASLEAELARMREAINQQIGGHELLLLAVDANDPAPEIKARIRLALKDARAALEDKP